MAKIFAELYLLKPNPETVCANFKNSETVRVSVSCLHLPPICPLCFEAGHMSKNYTNALPLYNLCKRAFHEEAICPFNKWKAKVKATDPCDSPKPFNRKSKAKSRYPKGAEKRSSKVFNSASEDKGIFSESTLDRGEDCSKAIIPFIPSISLDDEVAHSVVPKIIHK